MAKQITVSLADHHYYLTIPCYSGQIVSDTAASIIRASQWMAASGIKTEINMISSGALIDAVRNQQVAGFLASKCDTFVTIDADIEFDLVAFQRLLVHSHSHPIVLGSYPTRVEPSQFILNPTAGELTEDGLLPVSSAGAGFVAIQRRVFEGMTVPQYYKGEDLIGQYFKTGVIGEGNNYIGEDCWFFQEAIRQGFQPLLDPAIVLKHHGRKAYEGSLMDVLSDLLALGKESELGSGQPD